MSTSGFGLGSTDSFDDRSTRVEAAFEDAFLAFFCPTAGWESFTSDTFARKVDDRTSTIYKLPPTLCRARVPSNDLDGTIKSTSFIGIAAEDDYFMIVRQTIG